METYAKHLKPFVDTLDSDLLLPEDVALISLSFVNVEYI